MSLARILALIVAATGAWLGIGGAWLAVIGGSWMYAIIGAALMASVYLLWRHDVRALWLYAATLAVTLVWALLEVGLDWWQLAPRGDWLIILGILMVLPWVANPLVRRADSRLMKLGWTGLGTVLGISVVIAVIAMFVPSHDVGGYLPTTALSADATLTDPAVPDGEWQAYGRTTYGQRWSPLEQITPANVGQLQVAWEYHTGDIRGDADPGELTYEVTPLKIGNLVYLCTPHNLAIALDAETGEEQWRFDPEIQQPPKNQTQHLTCRGLSYDPGTSADPTAGGLPESALEPPIATAGDTNAAAAAPATETVPTATASAPLPDPDCAQRLFLPTVDARLIALSAKTGKVCPGFGGEDGTVDLWQNMPNVTPGSYYSTSPPVVTSRLVVVGGAVNDNVSTSETSGVVRAFDLATGELVWNWDSLNPEATEPIAAGQTYSVNSPNSWSVSSYDPELGLIYLPMGNQPPDQYGGNRTENAETYSASVVALHADTGRVAWVFQGVHHDLWDMDVPAQPSLVDLTIGGQEPAIVAPTKQGEIFVLNRETGEPLLPVVEEPAPTGAVEGDFTAQTQPVSKISFKPEPLTEASMWGISPFDQLACRIAFRSLNYEGRYTPPSEKGSIVYPGNFGTFNWGAVAVDPERQAVFAMPVYLAFTSTLVPRTNDQSRVVTKEDSPAFNENFGAPFAADMGSFLSPLHLPCQAPPWGYVAGADLTTGDIAYRHVNGTVQDLSPIPVPLKMGVPGIGGPIVTRGGVAFLSGTLDYYVRGYDLISGKQLWESRLPAGGQATPMTYWSDESERQFVLVVAGGHGSTGTKAGDAIIAYALPK